jgi:NAD(P)H-hydrate epimerase
MNYKPLVYYPVQIKKELYMNLQHQCEQMGISVVQDCPQLGFINEDFGVIVDALFGFSFKPPVRDNFKPIMNLLRETKVPIAR